MIVLTSNGLTSDALLLEMRTHINKGKAALVVTADPEYKEKNYHVARLRDELQLLNLEVDCFDFDFQDPSELKRYDVIEMIGGNPYYLLQSIRKNHFSPILQHFAESKCLIGCSAGSLVLTPSLALIDLYSPEMNFVGLKDLTALQVTDTLIVPHYSTFITRYDSFEEKCAAYEEQNHCTVVRLNDGDAVILSHGTVRVIRNQNSEIL